MDTTVTTLVVSAITISCLHTASGPDHYLPFIVLSRSKMAHNQNYLVDNCLRAGAHIKFSSSRINWGFSWLAII
jgi:hypothetical protein